MHTLRVHFAPNHHLRLCLSLCNTLLEPQPSRKLLFSACLVVPAGSDEDVCGDEGLIRRMMVGRLVGFLL